MTTVEPRALPQIVQPLRRQCFVKPWNELMQSIADKSAALATS